MTKVLKKTTRWLLNKNEQNTVGAASGTPATIDDLIQGARPRFHSFYIEEPKLVFSNGALSVDPKAGLETYGPFGYTAGTPTLVRIGVIGTGEGIQEFLNFLQRCQNRVSTGLNKRGKALDPHCFPSFPGCSPDQTFRTSFLADNTAHRRVIPEEFLRRAAETPNEQARIHAVVDLLVEQLTAIANLDEPPDLVIIVLPKVVEDACASIGASLARQRAIISPQQRFQRKIQRESARGQTFFPLDFDVASATDSNHQDAYFNIHHALKAHAMKTGLPTQQVWQSTFNETNLASVAWNLFTAIYYKAGNSPWRIQSLPDNTCYVGVAFVKESPKAGADMQTSLAQVFGAGEGLVLQGEKAVRDNSRDRQPHLTEGGAEKLLKQAIELYKKQNDQQPKRIVVHKTSRFWPEELKGFQKALGEFYHYDFLAIEQMETRFMRIGKKPVLRGTVVQLAPRHYLVFGNGYVPYLRAYPGKRLPCPLEIVEHHGVSPAAVVCQELLALTKLNWNSCAFGSSVPITIRFARDVGTILCEVPKGNKVESKYRFFM
jgi:hypothetical protein